MAAKGKASSESLDQLKRRKTFPYLVLTAVLLYVIVFVLQCIYNVVLLKQDFRYFIRYYKWLGQLKILAFVMLFYYLYIHLLIKKKEVQQKKKLP